MNSLDCVLRPRSIAVVGASDDVNKIGGRPLHYLRRYGYRGDVFAVNPRPGSVQGHDAYGTIEALPVVPDLAILATPASSVLDQIGTCARLGVGGVIVFASGYAETGAAGMQAQRELAAAARSTGMRLVGPNSIGSANFATGAVMSFASAYGDIPALDGPVAIVSQSGAVGVSVYAMARKQDVGVRYVCATGNQADVDVADYLCAVAADSDVRLVLLYVEEIKDIGKLQQAVRRLRTAGVVIVALASAVTPAGQRMAQLHTGSSGVSQASISALRELGCWCVSSIDELGSSAPAALRLALRPPSARLRVCIMSNSGASCVLGADACIQHEVALCELTPATVAALDEVLPRFSLSRNPIDLTAMLLADPSLLPRSASLVLADDQCDALALSLVATQGGTYDIERFARQAAEAAATFRKTLVFSSPDERARTVFFNAGLSSFRSESAAIAALRSSAGLHR